MLRLISKSSQSAMILSRSLCSANKSTIPADRLKGKVAVVTASTDGIGYAIAQRLGLEGAKVVVSSRKQKNVDSAVEKLKNQGVEAVGVVCHVANQPDRQKLYDVAQKHFGGIDILISNAAVNPTIGPVLECDEQSWDKIFDVNVKSAFLLAKEVVPLLRKRGGGNIVFVSSIAGFQPFPLLGAYSVSKTALFGLTKAASQELATDNIRVNCLAPGLIETKFSQALLADESSREVALTTIPMRRVGQSPEMASVVAFLVSDDASFITGEVIVAAGGAASRL